MNFRAHKNDLMKAWNCLKTNWKAFCQSEQQWNILSNNFDVVIIEKISWFEGAWEIIQKAFTNSRLQMIEKLTNIAAISKLT